MKLAIPAPARKHINAAIRTMSFSEAATFVRDMQNLQYFSRLGYTDDALDLWNVWKGVFTPEVMPDVKYGVFEVDN